MSFLIAHPTSPILDRSVGAADLCVCLSAIYPMFPAQHY